MEPYVNMAAAPRIIPPEKPELFGYYFQIPEKAEVKRVPISMLSSSVQQRISRLGGPPKTPFVIVVSPIIMQTLPNSHKARMIAPEAAAEHCRPKLGNQSLDGRSSAGKAEKWMRTDHGNYLVPVKCCKRTARTILQLFQNEETLSLETELETFSHPLGHNLQVMKMKASALCVYNNMMYLLPESKNVNASNEQSEAWEKVERSETTGFPHTAEETTRDIVQPKSKERSPTRERRHNGLGCVSPRTIPFLQEQSNRLDVGATIVKLANENRWDLPAEIKSTCASTSSPTENDPQISFWEHSRKQINRNMTTVGNREIFMKKLHVKDCDTEQDPPAAMNVFSGSPLHSHLSSGATSRLGPQESLSSLSSANSPPNGKTADLEGLSSSYSSLPCNIPTHTAPAHQGPGATCGDMSPPCLEVQFFPTLSEFSSSENSNEPDETASSSEPSLMWFEHATFFDVDDTTRDERTQRLLERVREFDKIVEDIRQKKLS